MECSAGNIAVALMSWRPAGHPVLWGPKLTYLDLERGLCRSAAFAIDRKLHSCVVIRYFTAYNCECSASEAEREFLGKD